MTKKINQGTYKLFLAYRRKGWHLQEISNVMNLSLSTVCRMSKFYNETKSENFDLLKFQEIKTYDTD